VSFSLGSIDPLNVQATWTGFDYPEAGQVLNLLGDGTTLGGNAVLQQSSFAFLEAKIHGTLTSSSDLSTLRGYHLNKTSVTFSDGSDDYIVAVMDLQVDLVYPSVWNYACRLLQVG
jgi:hypothetical protein